MKESYTTTGRSAGLDSSETSLKEWSDDTRVGLTIAGCAVIGHEAEVIVPVVLSVERIRKEAKRRGKWID